MGRLVLIILAISIFVGLIAPSGISKRPAAPASHASETPAAPAAAVPVTSGSGEIALDRDPSGHFQTEASVNGQSLPFVVDTGADIVALTITDARRAGLYVDPTGFTVIAEGASGPVKGQRVTLDRIELGGRTIEHVPAAILEGLGRNLLGQSVLTQLGGVEMKGDKMVLR